MNKEHYFPCTSCGACCRYLHLATELQHLDRGDGVCKHLTKENRCEIYETRPEICNIEYQYHKNYSHIPWDAFVAENLQICELLQLDQKTKASEKADRE
ncbi:hypothetical protein GCM10007161_20470 [Ignatzschineria indica]|uniref:Zinc/iron-chelating domain-containing protein n=1 Tax=Ignatzschineria indica TaxID=472583 RepID=A0A2U2AHP3_9GAMM|nr:YkgJ family cysteine cluster protein [Ignatzschineria indica]PWD82184.1 zinc/iron-chelating domain-containing protein [Ignatzschineria indica]GGZ88868.1 hypothetical protein GCM10007161_20470 [Ignatzschineria indica]